MSNRSAVSLIEAASPSHHPNDAGMRGKLMHVRPVANTIIDKTLGRYQSMQGDPKFVHEFIQMCFEEVQSLLVHFYETTVSDERLRISNALESKQIEGRDRFTVESASARHVHDGQVSQTATSISSRQQSPGRHFATPLLPHECYTITENEAEKVERSLVERGEISTEDLSLQKRSEKERETEARIDVMLSEGERNRKRRNQQLKIENAVPEFPLKSIGTESLSKSAFDHAEGSLSRAQSLYSAAAGDGGIETTSVAGPRSDQQQRFHSLINQVDSLQAELDVARSDQNFLRSLASDVIREIEHKDATINTLQGALEKREALINEQRRAYISELLHVREMLRQYREKGKCDLADATLYAWDTNSVQKFQEEEVKSKIDAAVMEVRRNAQMEKDVIEANFKKQMDDLRKKMVTMVDNSLNTTTNKRNGCVGDSSADKALFMMGATVSSPPDHNTSIEQNGLQTGRPRFVQCEEPDQKSFPPLDDIPMLRHRDSIHDTFTVDDEPKWDTAVLESMQNSTNSHDPVTRGTDQLPPKLPPPATSSGLLEPANNARSLQQYHSDEHDVEELDQSAPVKKEPVNLPPAGVPVSIVGAAGLKTTLIQLESVREEDATSARTPESFNQGSSLNEIALQNKVEVLEGRLAQRENMIERLRLLLNTASAAQTGQVVTTTRDSVLEVPAPTLRAMISRTEIPLERVAENRTGPTASDSFAQELTLLEERERIVRRQEQLQDKLMTPGALILETKVDNPSLTKISTTQTVEQSNNSNGSHTLPHQTHHTVVFGRTSHPARQQTPTLSNESADLHRQIFALQKQLANLTVSYEALCVKSKEWYTFYKSHKADARMEEVRIEAEHKLTQSVTLAEAAEERYRLQGWKIMRMSLQYRLCLANQRREKKEAEGTASFQSQLVMDRQLDALERVLSHKLLWLRQRHQDAREEANEAWDLVLIHAKAVARALIAGGEDVSAENTKPPFSRQTASSAQKLANAIDNIESREAMRDITERQLVGHKEACAQRRQFSAAAQQHLIEKYAVANVVKRYLASTTPNSFPTRSSSTPTGATPPRPPTVMLEPCETSRSASQQVVSHKPSVSSRPTSAAPGRSSLPSASNLRNEHVSVKSVSPFGSVAILTAEGTDAGRSEDPVTRPSSAYGTVLDPRSHMRAQAETDRVGRVRQQSLARNLKGLGVVEKLVQQRMKAAEVEEMTRKANAQAATVLGGEGSFTAPLGAVRGKVPEGEGEKHTPDAEVDEKGFVVKERPIVSSVPASQLSPFATVQAPRAASRPLSASTSVKSVSSVHFKKRPQTSSGQLKPDTHSGILTTASLIPRPHSAASSKSASSVSPCPPHPHQDDKCESVASFDVSSFRNLRPEQKRAELLHMLRHDEAVREEERKKAVSEIYVMRSHATSSVGGAAELVGVSSTSVGLKGWDHGRPSSAMASYAHSRGHNTGAPSAEPFVISTIGTLTTEQEILAGVHRTKLFFGNGAR